MNSPISIPDFDKIVWKCPCCKQNRTDKYIKVMKHDISQILGHEPGTAFINCKYCVDMPGCAEKAHNRDWVLKQFIPSLMEKVNNDDRI